MAKPVATGDADDHFRDYGRAIGLDLARYDECMQSGKYAGRIQASVEEGARAAGEVARRGAERRHHGPRRGLAAGRQNPHRRLPVLHGPP